MQDLFRHLRANANHKKVKCERCGSIKEPNYCHGHTQCEDCKCVIDDCCQGERN